MFYNFAEEFSGLSCTHHFKNGIFSSPPFSHLAVTIHIPLYYCMFLKHDIKQK